MGNNKELIALHLYYIWANFMRTKFDLLDRQKDFQAGELVSEAMIYMSYWYAGLYVVIEGWKEQDLYDSTIDSLIASENTDLLRRYRNGIFHFQKEYYDDRLFELIKEGTNVVHWIRLLNQSFGTYFADSFGVPPLDAV